MTLVTVYDSNDVIGDEGVYGDCATVMEAVALVVVGDDVNGYDVDVEGDECL